MFSFILFISSSWYYSMSLLLVIFSLPGMTLDNTVTEDMCDWNMEKHVNLSRNLFSLGTGIWSTAICVSLHFVIYSDEYILQSICTMLFTKYVSSSVTRTIFSFFIFLPWFENCLICFSCWSRAIVQFVALFPSAGMSVIFLWNTSGSSEIPQEMLLLSRNIPHLLISDVKICKHKIGNTMFPKEGSDSDTSWTEDNGLSHIMKNNTPCSGWKIFTSCMSPWLTNSSTNFPSSLRSVMISDMWQRQTTSSAQLQISLGKGWQSLIRTLTNV